MLDPATPKYTWTKAGLVVLWLLVVLVVVIELIRLWRPSARVRLLWIAALPLLALVVSDIALRFVVLS